MRERLKCLLATVVVIRRVTALAPDKPDQSTRIREVLDYLRDERRIAWDE